MLEELKAVNVFCLRLARDGLPSCLCALLNLLLSMTDSPNFVVPNSGFSLVTLDVNRLRSFLPFVDSYFSLEQSCLDDLFGDVMVRAAR